MVALLQETAQEIYELVTSAAAAMIVPIFHPVPVESEKPWSSTVLHLLLHLCLQQEVGNARNFSATRTVQVQRPKSRRRAVWPLPL